ncbi:hypothetical protein FH063_006702 [Azospirillum argentinense]|uniref:Uncharacterized protein n=1 Tax=Azospirillum argentinense TaxID=2970906 RepID=A0A5B0KRH2_9PROT|nr:hypothetical protein FH063_006702 [Azospirillum argentinense]
MFASITAQVHRAQHRCQIPHSAGHTRSVVLRSWIITCNEANPAKFEFKYDRYVQYYAF